MSARRSKRRMQQISEKARVPAPAAEAIQRPRRAMLAVGICALLVLSVALVYREAHSLQFISLDDPQYVSANPLVLRGLTRPGLSWAFSFDQSFYWHPLTWLSLMLDVSLFGVDPGALHVVNVVLHAANAVLLFLALHTMTGKRGPSAFVAALFALHPLHVESVAWIAERKDVLSTFFWMSALLAYAHYVRKPDRKRLLLVIFLFALGLLAKPMILTFPFVLLLLDYWPLGRLDSRTGTVSKQWMPLISEKIPLFALSFASVFATILPQRSTAAIISTQTLSVGARIGNALVSYVLYLRDTMWPLRLAPFYPLIPPSALYAGLAATALVLVTAGSWKTRRSYPYILVGWLWYLGTLIPVIGLLQAGDQGRADRFTYVPLIGIFIAIAWTIDQLFVGSTRRIAVATGIAACAVLMWLSKIQTAWWKNDLSLWGRTVSVTRDNYRAENLYGVALTDAGRADEGIQHYTAAITIWPEDAEAHNNLGIARMDQGRIEEAIREFKLAAELKPRTAIFHFNLGAALRSRGDTRAALKELETASNLEPSSGQYLSAVQMVRGEIR